MANFKPQVTVITKETVRESRNSYGKKSQYQTIRYKNYRELKKNLKKHIEENIELPVYVIRSKRGQWGEYFEHWQMSNGKPVIVKEGWC